MLPPFPRKPIGCAHAPDKGDAPWRSRRGCVIGGRRGREAGRERERERGGDPGLSVSVGGVIAARAPPPPAAASSLAPEVSWAQTLGGRPEAKRSPLLASLVPQPKRSRATPSAGLPNSSEEEEGGSDACLPPPALLKGPMARAAHLFPGRGDRLDWKGRERSQERPPSPRPGPFLFPCIEKKHLGISSFQQEHSFFFFSPC